MKFNFFLIIVISLVLTRSLYAGEVNVSVEKYSTKVGETIEIAFDIKGDLDQDPTFPKIDGMIVESGGRSSSVSIINGDISKSLILKYFLSFSKPGRFKIPAIRLNIDNKIVLTKPFQIQVSKVAALNNQQIAREKPLFFIKRSVNNETPYLGEPVIETFKIYRRIDWRGASRFGQDNVDLKYFEVKGTKESREEISGTLYGVTTLKRVFVPLKPGAIELGSFGIEVQYQGQQRSRRGLDPFDMFGRSRLVTKKILAPNLTIGVNTLPKENKPANFSGFVGDVEVIGNLSQKSLKTGDTTTLTVKIQGTGWVSSLELMPPRIDESQFKVYPDRPNTEETIDSGGISGFKSLKFALVPLKEGEVNLGQYVFNYFNPAKKQYVTKTVDLGTVFVEKGEDTSLTTNAPSNGSIGQGRRLEIKSSGTDIFDLKREIDLEVSSQNLIFIVYSLSGLLIIFVVFTEFKYFWRRSKSKPSSRKHLMYLLKSVRKISRTGDEQNLLDAFKDFIAREREVEKQSLTCSDIESHLKGLNTLVDFDSLFQSLRRAEAVKYGGESTTKDLPDYTHIISTLKKINL